MPKSDKKLKVVVKSLYSHEIRKDANLADLKSLKLEDAWPFMREEIEREIGSDRLVCVPFITEADLYKASSVFIKSKDGVNWRQYEALGELKNIIDESRTDLEYLNWLKKAEFIENDFNFPHESVKITLQDDEKKNKVRVILVNFQKASFPGNNSPVKKIFISKEKCPNLKAAHSVVYIITHVLMAKTVEFRVTTGISSRIFHLGNSTPLVFGFERFKIDQDGQLLSEEPVEIESKSMHWNKVYPSDCLWSSQSPKRNIASAN